MEPEHHSQEHGSGYDASGQWMENATPYHSQHQSPVHEYNGYMFNPMPIEPMYSASTMPTMPPPRTAHQQLQPLIMPPWPSMLTSASGYSGHSSALFPSAPIAAPPISAPMSAPPTTGRPQSTPRKTLTDADRRKMCQYAEAHPTVKQTEIGAMFGVERSTVSKVLRNKEKYMAQDDGSKSPARKAKGKFPDIERALSNWARGRQRQGMSVTDGQIKEKLRYFASTVGSPDSHIKANNSSWLEKFKQKNGLLGSKSRKSSVAEESDVFSNPESGGQTPNISPTSPAERNEKSPSAMSIVRDEKNDKADSPDHFNDFSPGHKAYASMSSAFTDGGHSSFSPGPISPTSPFFSDNNVFGAPVSSSGDGYQRPRSQTFPILGLQPASYASPPSSGALTPKYMSSTTLESPAELISAGPSDSHVSLPSPADGSRMDPLSPALGLAVQASSPLTPASSIGLPPMSPSLDDTRRALEVVMNFFQHQPSGFVEPQEYVVMGKLMEKLKIQHRGGGEMPGGMHRIGEGAFSGSQ